MNLIQSIQKSVVTAIQNLYQIEIAPENVQLKQIPKHLSGDFSVITFPFVQIIKKSPIEIAEQIAGYLSSHEDYIELAEAAGKGFVNLSIGSEFWTTFVQEMLTDKNYGLGAPKNIKVVIEYSSPNTNKPLHLGHVRNNLLGYSTAKILETAGYEVKKVQIINDRGIHICKSMLAWQKYGKGETPSSAFMKGDHLVGKYYVTFEKVFQEEYAAWQKTDLAQEKFNTWSADEKLIDRLTKQWEKKDIQADETYLRSYFFKSVFKNEYFNKHSEIGAEAKKMLQGWESGNPSIRSLWVEMNQWVYDGFEQTYKDLGVDFDKLYYESDTYLKGKAVVDENFKEQNSIFFQKEDGSVWIDLSAENLDEKVVLRSDGTSMYITQDIGTAILRYEDFEMNSMVYVVGNEQDYHFKVLFNILKKLGYTFADHCHHLSYGMVNLTTGKMKSREGTVVDADHLMEDIIEDVRKESQMREKLEGLKDEERDAIYRTVAMGALKFYILKVEPKKNMIFDPQQSIDLQGQTGPYIQNAHVKTQSVQRMFEEKELKTQAFDRYQLNETEKDILVLIHDLPMLIQKAAEQYDPSNIANYVYDLAKEFHRFWSSTTILDLDDMAATTFRLYLSKAVAKALKLSGGLIGMEMPDRM